MISVDALIELGLATVLVLMAYWSMLAFLAAVIEAIGRY